MTDLSTTFLSQKFSPIQYSTRLCSWFSFSTLHHVRLHYPSSTLISISMNHHLYAYDNSFLSFHPTQLRFKHYSPTTYFSTDLYLDDCKSFSSDSSMAEFLLIGLKKQLTKIHNSSLNTTHSARKLGFIFDEHLTLPY